MTAHAARPLLGLRRSPGKLALAVFRTPLPLYRHRLGRLLGHTFLVVAHAGRKTGARHETVAMVLRFDARARGAIVCSAWGAETDWIRNIRARPALEIRIGAESYVPEQRFLTEDEAVAVVREFQRSHPLRTRLVTTIFGWGDLTAEPTVREFVASRPFVSFTPTASEGSAHVRPLRPLPRRQA